MSAGRLEHESFAPPNAVETFASLRPERCEEAGGCDRAPAFNCLRCTRWVCDHHRRRQCLSSCGLTKARHSS